MIPWNPIHRYAGMTSLFDSLDEQQSHDAPRARFDAGTDVPQTTPMERAPLGFVDVRAEVEMGAGSPRGSASEESGSEASTSEAPAPEASVVVEPNPAPVVPHVELSETVADSQPAAEEKVPFYKREISLGRKKGGAEVETAVDAVEDVPFYKREISFRRSSTAPEPVEPEIASPSAETVPEAVAVDPEPVAAPQPVEPVAAEPASVQPQEEEEITSETQTVVAESVESDPVPVPDEIPAVELIPSPEPEAPVLNPAPVAKVPLYKREISFGKNGKRSNPQKKGRGGVRSGRKIVGLKIGASQLAAAVVQEIDGRHELIELARTPLEPGIVLDGEVRDSDALVSALRAFFADQKLPTKDVRIGIASNRIGVRTFEIAGIDDEARFDNAVRFKAHEVLPIAVSDSVLDYRVLEDRQLESGESARRILLVVAPRDQVAPYVEVAQQAGLRLAGIDLEALGLLRAFVEPGEPRTVGGTSTVVVAIGHEASTLLVSGGGACEFTRVFDWGGATLQDAIAQELQVHPAEAATILRHLSLSGNSRRVEGIEEDARNRAVEAVRLRLTPFARELVSSLQFYQTQPDSLGIGEIVITGGTSQLDGLGDALHQMIGVQVRIGDPLQRLSVRTGVESGFEQSLGSLAVPIGLAIDDDPMRSVDLTPRDIARQSRRPNLVPVLLPVAAAVPLAALGFFFSQAHGNVSHRHSKLSSLQTTLAALPQPTGPQIDASLHGNEAARASAVAQVLGGRSSWDGMLRDLSRVLPENVWLTGLKASVASPLSSVLAATAPGTAPSRTPTTTASQTPAPVTPTGVTIVGYTFSQSDVAVLLARLVALSSLQNVQLQSAANATVGKKDVVQFTILADLRGAGGGA